MAQYYAKGFESIMLKEIIELGLFSQVPLMENVVARKVDAFLQYAATYPITKYVDYGNKQRKEKT